ncbi:hypothetical protein GALMADRAFT_124691 [Galerina marginata CBS 339.88]|uniref:L-ornithine N(5)-oxygenase n=1 Tax=Galerina marginata (strain CBS 339.88) TaxID=685588 RepID=A0A067T3E1_GALM3|nr:hypothetical protein GALMADRAFT_124691 [Galerina marginata CBS 339.88]
MSAGETKRTPHVVIVGAGIAGIATAIALKRQLNFDDFTIYEQADAIGGTWRDNTYPGCGSDVPGHWYSLSTDLNPRWRSYYANQPELRAYWEDLWHKHDLVRHTVLATSVANAEWSIETQRYTVHLEHAHTGEKREVQAEVLFYAIGGFQAPFYPKDLLGLERFRGDLWHSARWRHDVALHKKRVGVIGNGCSAAQLIPEISKDPSVNVINFCRTPQWYVPRVNFQYPRRIQWMFAHIPFLMRCYRNWIMARSDFGFLVFRKDNKRLLNIAKKTLTAYIKSKVPKEELENMIPNYSPGCKRIIADPGYLDSLKQPNVSLRWDSLDSVVENGVRMKSGEVVPLDVIVFSTGYSVESPQLKVRGSKGGTIHEYAASKGGPQAYLGSCIPGFPNLFLLLGPNVASGHASVIFSEEAQINLAMQLIRPVLQGQAKSFEVTDEATDEYNDWLQRRLQSSVWTDCVSYYQAGRDSKSRIVATFPGPVTLLWWFCRRPRWELFRAVGAERWERQRTLGRVRKWALMTVLVSVVGFLLSGESGWIMRQINVLSR